MRVGVMVWLACLAGCASRALDLPEKRPADLAASPFDGADLAVAPDLGTRDLFTVDLRAAHFDLARADLARAADLLMPGSCGDNDVLVGTACVKRSCQAGDGRRNCLIPDAGIGQCSGTLCTGIDFLNDPENCGFFGGVCPAGTPCTNGFCYGACTATSCPAGLSCDTSATFGGCDLPSCDGAHDYQVCHPTASYYPNYASQCCGTSCTHLLSDPKNCGSCSHVCPGSAQCIYGVCDVDCSAAVDNTRCAAGVGYCCGGACIYDGDGCGCGVSCFSGCATTPCPAGEACVVYGFGPFDVCAATSCAGLPEGWVCAATDADGVAQAGYCCADSCVALATDAQNCGACGRQCPAGEICAAAQCVPKIDCAHTSDSSPCQLSSGVQGMCCSGACVDVHTDNVNCGACAQACPPSLTCHGTSAVFGNGQCQDASGIAQNCGDAHPCAAGYACSGQMCLPVSCSGLADGTQCSQGNCCGGQCVSLSTLTNCGTCGRACPAGSTDCFAGVCSSDNFDPLSCSATAPCPAGNTCIGVTCPTFWPNWCAPRQCFPSSCAGRSEGVACAFGPATTGTCCAGVCVSTDRDPANCGSCGADCGGGLCAGGSCLVAAVTRCVPGCPAGTICYQVGPFDGGSSTGVCVGPVCGLLTYNNPELNSGRCLAQDGALGQCCSDGTCADITHDPKNCGGCGIDCGEAACVNGSCLGAACDYAHEGGFCDAQGDWCLQGSCQ